MNVKSINKLLVKMNQAREDGKEIQVMALSNYVIFFVGDNLYRLKLDRASGAREVASTFKKLVEEDNIPKTLNVR